MLPASRATVVHGFMAVEGAPGGAQPDQGRMQNELVVLDADQQDMASRGSPASGDQPDQSLREAASGSCRCSNRRWLMTKDEINAEVKAIIRRSDLWSPTDSPETVATLMVLTVLMSLGIPHEQAPEVMLKALARLNPPA